MTRLDTQIGPTLLRADAIAHLNFLFGKRKGYVALAFKVFADLSHTDYQTRTKADGSSYGWMERAFLWPAQADALLTEVEKRLHDDLADVFIAPNQFHTPSRRPVDALPSKILHLDYDKQSKPMTKDQRLDLIDLDPVRVKSGSPGNFHAYLKVDKAFKPDVHAATLRRLRDLYNGDNKVAVNDLLRLAGTFNYKIPTHPVRVSFLSLPTAVVWDRDELVAELAVTADDIASVVSVTTMAAWDRVKVPRLSIKAGTARVLGQFEAADGDRSEQIYNAVCTMKEAGWSRDQIHTALDDRGTSKFSNDRLHDDVDRIWQKHEVKPVVKKSTGSGRIKLIRASEIKVKRVKWLWHHRIPLGGLSLIGGREGQGKSTIVVDIIAKTTRGTLEGELSGKPRDVIYMTTEDSWESTVVPRLMAAGADLDRVHQMVPTEVGDSPIRFAEDLVGIEAIVKEMDVALIAVDPILSALGDDVDDTRGKELRKMLEAINTMASDSECAVLGIIHFRKLESHDVGMMFSGSLVWSQVPRATLGVVPHPTKENSFILGRGKNNLAPPITDLEGTIETVAFQSDDGEIKTSKIVGLSESEFSLKDAMNPGAADRKDDKVTDWLVTELSTRGEAPASDIIARAEKIHSVSERTIKRKFHDLKGVSSSKGFGKDKQAHWSLPGHWSSMMQDVRKVKVN